MRSSVFLPVLLLAACATSFEEQLDRWVGYSEADVRRAWGEPAKVEDGAPRRLTYVRQEAEHDAPGDLIGMFSRRGVPAPHAEGAGPVYARQCTATLEIVDGQVRAWRWEAGSRTCRPR